MNFSINGEQLSRKTGIFELMEDLTLLGSRPEVKMLGGGAPAKLDVIERVYRRRVEEITKNGRQLEEMLGSYVEPAGNLPFRENFAALLEREYGWKVTAKNILLTNGSQSSFFMLVNLLAGRYASGKSKRIMLPLVPEYIGYSDLGIEPGILTARRPQIELSEEHFFKYSIDFNNLQLTDDIAALLLSRPTNPSGNLISDEELERLLALTGERNIPLIVDCAYGNPFPGAVFKEVSFPRAENLIATFSLSKCGLPGIRTGIVVAHEDYIEPLTRMNGTINLAVGGLGPELFSPLLATDEILHICRSELKPFYAARSRLATEMLQSSLDDSLPYRLHRCEGSFFLWLWLPESPVKASELYNRLKAENVVVVPGNYYFPGFSEKWAHRDECLRISYVGKESDLESGLKIIGRLVRESYGG